MDNLLISIIVPVYNSSRFLNRCIDSILKQTYSNLEVILVDDGSVDESPKICDDYSKQDQRVIVIHKKNNGAAAARNSGLDIAKGDYIGFVDSDDYIDDVMYEKMIDKALNFSCDVVMCDCLKEDNQTSKLFTHPIREGYYDSNALFEEYYPSLLITNSVDFPATISNWTMIVKRDLIEYNHFRYKEGMRFCEDWLFGSQVMSKANSFYYLKEKAYYHYILNLNSVSHSYYKNKWELMFQLYTYIEEYFSNINNYDFSKQIDLALLYIVYHCIGNVHNDTESNTIKKLNINNILSNDKVEGMFKRISINKLNISWKLKLITYLYKYKKIYLLFLLNKF